MSFRVLFLCRRAFEGSGAARRRIVREEPMAAVEDEASRYDEVFEPGGRLVSAVEMNLTLLARKEVRVALEFERGAPANRERECQEALKGYDDLFPLEVAARAAVDATSGLPEPSMGDILRTQLAVVAARLQPSRIDEKALREELFEVV
jgi:hypothetical protein